jgi:SAM-dependent methyltransferase
MRGETIFQGMNYQAIEETIKAGYREVTPRYRRDDEIEVTTDNHRRISATLREICLSFNRPIRALEAGCGTGRYFHCLKNVNELVGLDISEDMLRAAENPVRPEEVSAECIRLVLGNIYLMNFPPGYFDLVYSLGMFGNGCPVTVDLLNKFHDWLAPGGRIYFNTVDTAGLPLWYRARRQARGIVYPILNRRWQSVLDEREARHPFFGMSQRELEGLLRKSRFAAFQVKSHVCRSPLWTGRHLECIATKASGSN